MTLRVLPRPKKVVSHKGWFRFADSPLIVLSAQANDSERTAALLLADAVADSGGPAVSVERHGKLDRLKGTTVQMFLIGRDNDLCPEIKKLTGLPKGDLAREGYIIDISPARVLVGANSPAGLFYAAQTLIQLLDADGRTGVAWPCCRIVDWPDFKFRGFMLDVSRFRMPRTETLEELVVRLAACKINVLQLYVEHTFRCRRHPEYSAGVSPLTAEQLSDLDELCQAMHIELQANQNSLGHLQHLLRLPKFAHLAERPMTMPPYIDQRGRTLAQPWSLRLDREEVYRLLDDIYAEHLPAVRAKLVNLGCDEAWDLGSGRSKRLVERKGKVRAFVDHVKRISKLARKYGKQTMIWEDMIRHNPEVLGMLPKDIIPVFWHYGEKPEPNYEKIWAGSGHRHWVAPGCCSWQSITSQVERAWANIHWMTGVGRKGGAEGVLNTEWGDCGNFQTLAVSYMSIAIGAELSWNSEPMTSRADFDRRFARAMFADRGGRIGQLYRLLGRTNHVFRKLPYQGPPWLLYWAKFPGGEPRTAGLTGPEMDRCRAVAQRALTLANRIRRDPPPGIADVLLEELVSAADQTIFACRKGQLALRVNAALAGGGKLSAGLKAEVRKLAGQWKRQRAEFERVWLLGNEPSQIDYYLDLYDQRARDFAKLLGN